MTLRLILLLLINSFVSLTALAAHNHHQSGKNQQIEDSIQFNYLYSKGSMNDLNMSEDKYFSDTSFMVKPESMEMEMHMLGVHYTFNRQWSFMVMGSYQKKQMDMIRRMGRSKVSMSAEGVGDTKLNLNYLLELDNHVELVYTGGISVPTGSITKKDNSNTLPYGMQLGSGSYGVIAGVNLTKIIGKFEVFSSAEFLHFLNQNSEDYRLGLESSFDLSVTYLFHQNFSFTIGGETKYKDPLKSDEDTISGMSSSFDPSNQNGSRSHYSAGLQVYYKEMSAAVTFLSPISEDLSGIQFDSGDKLKFEVNIPM
jgi:hypothetical protein